MAEWNWENRSLQYRFSICKPNNFGIQPNIYTGYLGHFCFCTEIKKDINFTDVHNYHVLMGIKKKCMDMDNRLSPEEASEIKKNMGKDN